MEPTPHQPSPPASPPPQALDRQLDRRQLGLARQVPLRHRDLGHPDPSARPLRPKSPAQTRVPVACRRCRRNRHRIRHRDRLARSPGGPGPCVPHIGNGLFGAPRAEMRITDFGTSSPLRDPENTGALAIFVFRPGPGIDSPKCRVWICRNPVEADVADDLLGPVEPGFPAPWGSA